MSSPVDVLGLRTGTAGNVALSTSALKFNASTPGIVVSGTKFAAPLLVDNNTKTLTVTRNAAAYTASGGQGILLFHFHNVAGNKAQVVTIS